jgi:hypothetical protein
MMMWMMTLVISRSYLKNAKSSFDRPFDRLTVLSKVEGLTTLSGRL